MITLSKETRSHAVKELQRYFLEERGEEIGCLGAGLLLDFMLATIGPAIYNQAIEDARAMLLKQMDELYSLEKPL